MVFNTTTYIELNTYNVKGGVRDRGGRKRGKGEREGGRE